MPRDGWVTVNREQQRAAEAEQGQAKNAGRQRVAAAHRERQEAEARTLAAWVVAFWADHGYGPSMREAAEHLGVQLGSAQRRIRIAADLGHVWQAERVNRTLSTPELREAMRRFAATIAGA